MRRGGPRGLPRVLRASWGRLTSGYYARMHKAKRGRGKSAQILLRSRCHRARHCRADEAKFGLKGRNGQFGERGRERRAGLIRRACWRCALPVRRTGGARSGSGYARRTGRTNVKAGCLWEPPPWAPSRPSTPPSGRSRRRRSGWPSLGIALALSRFSAAPRFISRARWVVPLISHAPPPVALFSKPLCWQAGGRPTKSHTHNLRPPAVSSTYGGGR